MIAAIRRRRRPLLVAAATGIFWWLAIVSPRLYFQFFPAAPNPADFSLYIAGARVGILHGWSHIYDVSLQRSQYYSIHKPDDPWAWYTFYVTPPPVAWLVAPLALLPYPAAFYLFAALNCVVFAAAGWLIVPGDRLTRVTLIMLSATTYPFLMALQMGQVTILLAALPVLSWWLLRRDRQVLAGLVLAPLLVKPQVIYLVPLALLAQRRLRLTAALAVGIAILAALSLASLGTAGIEQWRAVLRLESGEVENQVWTPAYLVGIGPVAYLLEIAAVVVVVAIAVLAGRKQVELGLAAALAGSLVAAPYHHSSDAVVLLVAGWFYLRAKPPTWHAPWLLFGLTAAVMTAPWGPRPLLVFTLGWLLLMMLWSLHAHRNGAVVERTTTTTGPTDPERLPSAASGASR